MNLPGSSPVGSKVCFKQTLCQRRNVPAWKWLPFNSINLIFTSLDRMKASWTTSTCVSADVVRCTFNSLCHKEIRYSYADFRSSVGLCFRIVRKGNWIESLADIFYIDPKLGSTKGWSNIRWDKLDLEHWKWTWNSLIPQPEWQDYSNVDNHRSDQYLIIKSGFRHLGMISRHQW